MPILPDHDVERPFSVEIDDPDLEMIAEIREQFNQFLGLSFRSKFCLTFVKVEIISSPSAKEAEQVSSRDKKRYLAKSLSFSIDLDKVSAMFAIYR